MKKLFFVVLSMIFLPTICFNSYRITDKNYLACEGKEDDQVCYVGGRNGICKRNLSISDKQYELYCSLRANEKKNSQKSYKRINNND